MVSGVVRGKKHGRFGGIAGDFVEVDDGVEGSAGTDPLIHRLANLLALRRGVAGTDVGSEGCADDFDSVGMGARNQLGEGEGEVLRGDIVSGLERLGHMANVVDAFKDDDVFHSALREHVAVKTREGVWAGSIMEEAVASDAFVQHGKMRGLWVFLKAPGENVRPAAVRVARGLPTVRNGVAEGHDGCRLAAFLANVNSLHEAP